MSDMRRGMTAALLCLILFCAGCDKQADNKTMGLDLGGGVVLETYTGALKNGRPDGTGAASLSTDGELWEYTGSFGASGPYIGQAVDMPASLTVAGNTVEGTYTGGITDMKMAGEGVFTATDGSGFVCSGTFDRGQILSWELYDVKCLSCALDLGGSTFSGLYDGIMKGGRPEGTGTFSAAGTPALTCSGTFEAGALSGSESAHVTGLSYTLPYENSTLAGVYEGDTVGGLPEGTGTFTCSGENSRYVYTGGWKGGSPSGEGWLNTDLYVVHFDEFDRTGTYDGETLDGAASGTGTFSSVTSDGVSYTYEGQWSEGQWDGYGTQTYDDAEQTARIGTFTKGNFTPSFQELLQTYGTSVPKFTAPDSVLELAQRCAFEMSSDELASNTDGGLMYEQYIKSPGNYTDRLMYLTGYYVVQISEWTEKMTDGSGALYDQQVTEMIIQDEDSDHVCWVYFFGALDGLYEGGSVSVRGLPLGYSSYQSIEDVTIKCIVLLGAEVEYW